mmetsp:Transcript_17686/g.62267  ORF Transcript_17686/g.62267 Transcript_17686/m.62267 type:complete len:387 (-) Transcript_17686:165-1325(-)
MEELTKAHPDLQEAIAFALREVSIHRPPDPISFTAHKLVEWNSKKAKPTPFGEGKDGGGAGGKSDESDEDDDAEDDTKSPEDEAMFEKMRGRTRGRRSVVFAEPVQLDESWVPTVVPKSDDEKDRIREIMSKNILFRTLEGDQLELLIDVMVAKEYKNGEEIITQGAAGDYYYVLDSGTCDIHKDSVLVLQVSFGMGFGELALMYDAPRAATVTATSDVKAWAIDRVSFKQVMMGTTTKKRDLYKSFLEGVELLSTLTEKERLTVADALQPFTFEAGADVIKEGDTDADRFYIVEEGELKATKAGVDGEVCPRLTRGAYFGEVALVEDRPRAATVTAVTKSKCLAMDRAAFVRLLGNISDLLKRNMEVYARYESTITGEEPSESKE